MKHVRRAVYGLGGAILVGLLFCAAINFYVVEWVFFALLTGAVLYMIGMVIDELIIG